MKEAKTELLELLRASLNGCAAETEYDTDWQAVLAEANAQTVTALAAKGLPASVPDEVRKRWREAEYSQFGKNIQYYAAQDELCELFAESAIPAVIIKGAAAAVYYPDPLRRATGDIDLLVREEDYERAKKLLQDAGFQTSGKDSGRHISFQREDVEVELHHRFSYLDLDMENYLAAGFENLETGMVAGHAFPMLPRLANGLILLGHMRAHLKVGLGLRQVIDWMAFVERELDDEFWQREFCEAARSLKLDTLAITMTRLCQKHLGLSAQIHWCEDADEALCATLLKAIMDAGNFGIKRGSTRFVGSVSYNIRKEGFFRYLQRAGEQDWALCRRYRWLKPFAWLREGFVFLDSYVRYRNKKESVVSEIQGSRERYQMMKELNLL